MVRGLPVIVSGCKNVFKEIQRQALIPSKSIQCAHSVVFIQEAFQIQPVDYPSSYNGVWAHIPLLLTSTPKSFPPGSFPAILPQNCSDPGDCCDQGLDPAFLLAEPYTIGLSPLMQPIQIPL